MKPRRIKQKKAAVIVEKPPTPRAVAHLITNPLSSLPTYETELLNRPGQKNNLLATMIRLGRTFAEMVRQQRPDQLNPWLLKAKQCGMPRLRNFANGICRDYAAARAALCLSYSSGPTEGQISRLKCLKRQMYGRAKLDLLKARLISG